MMLSLDREITLAVNGWHSAFGDAFFWVFTKTWVWVPLFAVLVFLLIRENGWRKAVVVLAGMTVALLLADQACNLIKITVCRPRPTHEPLHVGQVHTVNGYVGGMYGFCSAHAANTMALMLFTSMVVRRWQYVVAMASWVVVSCWSRIYLGVHYVGDIIAGLAVGTLCALAVYLVYRKMVKCEMQVSQKSANALIISYMVLVLGVLINACFGML